MTEVYQWEASLHSLVSDASIAGVAVWNATSGFQFGHGLLKTADTCSSIQPNRFFLYREDSNAAQAETCLPDTSVSTSGTVLSSPDTALLDTAAITAKMKQNPAKGIEEWSKRFTCAGQSFVPFHLDSTSLLSTSKYKRFGCLIHKVVFGYVIVVVKRPTRIDSVANMVEKALALYKF